jgi:DNA-binding MarR family transcriptional regulator
MEPRSGTRRKIKPRCIINYSSSKRLVAMKKTYTDKQGQYLVFIYYYSKIHGCSPSEAEMQRYFRVSPPAVHQMVLTLEAHELIARTPGQARSIHLLISRDELPDLI